MRQWRVIYDQTFQTGKRNMAIDGAILESVSAGEQLPTLRLYGWNPMCLSLGYGQRVREVDFEGLERHGWDVVRRPTGGRAILHGDELTYSVSLPIEHELAQGDVVESYRRISLALLNALQHLGLSPRSERQDDDKLKGPKSPVCFEVPSHYEITAGGLKLIGSAQVRRKEGILQHGSLPLCGDVARICEALAFDTPEDRQRQKEIVRERATTLEGTIKKPIAWQTAADAVARGFEERFDLNIIQDNLSFDEEQRMKELLVEQFDNPDWTHKR